MLDQAQIEDFKDGSKEEIALGTEGWRGKCDRLEKERAELLEALKSIEDYWNQDQNETAMADACWHAINTARAAIAKATGESE